MTREWHKLKVGDKVKILPFEAGEDAGFNRDIQ